MKRYLLRVSIFMLLVAALFGGWSAVLLSMELTAYAREAKLSEDVRYVVCGGSETQKGLLAELWPGFFNFSIDGITLDQIELKTIDFFERNSEHRPEIVLIDVSPQKLIAQDISVPLIEAEDAGKRFLLHALQPQYSRRSLDGLAIIFRDVILVNRTKFAWKSLRKRRPYTSSIGGDGSVPNLTEEQLATNRQKILSKEPTMGFKDHPKHTYERMKHQTEKMEKWWTTSGPLSDESETVQCVRNIIAIVRENGSRPVLITPPWHEKLRSAVNPKQIEDFYATMHKIAAEEGISYLDYLSLEFPDEDWRDGNHLNTHGAVKFTETVRHDVEAL